MKPLVRPLAPLAALCLLIAPAHAALTTNSWTVAGNGKWEIGANWSAGVPISSDSANLITNATTKTVTVDSTTLVSNAVNGCLTISNLTVRGIGSGNNTLQVSNTPALAPFHILNGLTISTNAFLLLTNGFLTIDGLSGGDFTIDGSVTNSMGGVLVASNATTIVGTSAGAVGKLVVRGGTTTLSNGLIVGATGSTGDVLLTAGRLDIASGGMTLGSNGVAQFTQSGGTNLINGVLIVSFVSPANATLTLSGGQLVATNNNIIIGRGAGPGQFIQSGGSARMLNLTVGRDASSQGTFTFSGGTNEFASVFTAGQNANSTGTIWLTGGRLVTTNAATSIGIAGEAQMTASSGVWLASNVLVGRNAGGIGTLTIAGGTNAMEGPLTVGGVNATGTVLVTGGQLVVTNNPELVGAGSGFVIDGSVTLTNGSSIIVSNVVTIVGNRGSGSFAVFGGSMLVSNLIVGNLGRSDGTLTFTRGAITVADTLTMGNTANATGTLWVSNGTLTCTNGLANLLIGAAGRADLIVSNGTVLARQQNISSLGGVGTLTVVGGTNVVTSSLIVGSAGQGAAWIKGGSLLVSNTVIRLGNGNATSGQMTISNGLAIADEIDLAPFSGSSGTLTVVGGTNTVKSSMTLGTLACDATGTVVVSGGKLFVTNAAGDARLEIRSGTLTLSAGTLAVNNLVMSNACGRFWSTGGTFSITSTNIDGNLDADGDGLPNSWETSFGLSPFSNTGNDGAGGDPDGDGYTNAQEFQAGTNPTNPASAPPGFTSWNTSSSGKWETDANWSAGAPASIFQSVWLTNANTKTVTLDATTTNTPATLTISNLAVRGFGAGTNTVRLTNAGTSAPLRILNTFTVGTNALLVVSNSAVQVDGMFGGSLTVDGSLTNSAGSQIVVTNTEILIGTTSAGRRELITAGGRLVAKTILVGSVTGSKGTLTAGAGTNSVYSSLTLGTFDCLATGIVTVAGGSLFVTNATTNAVLEVRSGTLMQSSGTLTIDNLAVTNACGRFIRYFGTLSIGSTNLAPNFSAVGDGIPNSWKQQYGFDVFSPNVASADPDGDGMPNLVEYQAGTDPTDASSTPFRITSIQRQGDNIQVTWTTSGDSVILLQASQGAADGSYSNNFYDVCPRLANSSSGLVTNSYNDLGGATNSPARFYRARLVPGTLYSCAGPLCFDWLGNTTYGFGSATYQSDPGPGDAGLALTYPLGPFAGTQGDVRIKNAAGQLIKVIRFNGNGTLVFYTIGFCDTPSDSSGPSAFYGNQVEVIEGSNGVTTYTPSAGQPGYDLSSGSGGQPFYFISD